MKPLSVIRNYSLSLFAVVLTLLAGSHVAAQTTTDSASAEQTSAVPARITQPIDETQLFELKGSVHPLTRVGFDQGPVEDATPMKRMMLVLRRSPDQQAALSKLMYEQVIKDSPNYHNWLTPQEFGQKFGPSDDDIAKVTQWLGSKGFSDIRVSNGRVTIEFSGNVGQVRGAFHTDIHRFLVEGELKQANTTSAMIPAALSPVVGGIVALHNFYAKSMRKVGPEGILTGRMVGGKFVPEVTGGNNSFFAVGPGDFAKIYNITSGMDGTGGKIAIIGFSDINPADVDAQRALFGLGPKNLNIVVNGGDPGFNGEEGEAALDVQTAGSVATKAQIDYILSEPTLTADPIILGAEYVIDNNTDDVMSLSFGNCELNSGTNSVQGLELSLVPFLWEEAAAQGISVTISAGDNGSAGCDDFTTAVDAQFGTVVNGLASTPFNIAVGGTDFDDAGTQISGGFWSSNNATGSLTSANGYIHEIPWNDSCAFTATPTSLSVCTAPNGIVGGSGGPSVLIKRPSFQSGLVPNGIAASDAANHRYLPDVSLFASSGFRANSFYIECLADQNLSCVPSGGVVHFQPVGGTSASSPAFAGILAIIGQSEANATRSRRLGNANLVLYNLAATAANSCNSSTEPVAPASTTCIFNDITKGNNSVPCAAGSPNCSTAAGGPTGVLVTVNGATKTPAFTATAGYDLASGLGSVNVANLAGKWHSATLSASTVTTTVNSGTTKVTITHGTAVTLGTKVMSGGGTPTGDVSFLAPPATPNGGTDCALETKPILGSTCTTTGFVTLSSGSGSQMTTSLPGGSYNIKAHYGGDVNFAPSDDPTGVPVQVNQEGSSLQMGIVTFDPTTGNITSTNATTFTYGSGYDLRMDILNHTGTSANCQPLATNGVVTGCALDATGKVTLTDNGSPLDGGSFNVNSEGSVEDQTINLTGGTHTVVGTYSGDNSYSAPVASTTLSNLMVAKATTTITLASNLPSVAAGSPVMLTATIGTNSTGVGPTGSVTFSACGTPPCTATLVPTNFDPTTGTAASAVATLTTSFSSAGARSITATYNNGDGNYNGSGPSTAVTVTVTGGSASFTVSGPTNPVAITAGMSGSATITVTPSGGFTGMVTVNCPTSLPPGITCTPPGAINVTTTAAVTGSMMFSVAAPSSSMTASNTQAERVYLARAAAPQSSGKGGWYALGGGTGLAAMLVLFLPGRKRIRAAMGLGLVCALSFALGCGGGSSSGGGPVATTTQLMVSATKVMQNGSITVSAMVTGRTPTGNVQFLVDGTAAGNAVTLTGGSTGNLTVTGLNISVGTHTLSAHYSGDTSNLASQSGTLNIAVTGTTPALTITGTSGGTMVNGSVTLTIN